MCCQDQKCGHSQTKHHNTCEPIEITMRAHAKCSHSGPGGGGRRVGQVLSLIHISEPTRLDVI
eukprot:6733119-Prorocentrum_lima.AAC.1